MKKNKELKNYLKEIKKELYCSRQLKSEILHTLESSVEEYLDQNPDIGISEIREHFGSPEDFARESMSALDYDDVHQLKKSNYIKLTAVITSIALVLVFVVTSIMAINEDSRTAFYSEETGNSDDGSNEQTATATTDSLSTQETTSSETSDADPTQSSENILPLESEPDINESVSGENVKETTPGETSASSSVPETSSDDSAQVRENNPMLEIEPELNELISSGIVYDVTEQQILFCKNSDERVYPASLTKLVTACTALKYVPTDAVFTVGSEQNFVHADSSLCLIQRGYQLTLEDLLCGMLIESGNDAAYTIAVNVARTITQEDMTDKQAVAYFCDLMNAFAAELGMSNSHFTNPDGWDNKNQYSTAYDLLKIALYVQNNGLIKEITSCDKKDVVFASGQSMTWENSNWLLDKEGKYYYRYATGMKTGTTDSAGKALISSAEKYGKTVIVIGLGSNTDEQRFRFAIEVFEKALNRKPKNLNCFFWQNCVI